MLSRVAAVAALLTASGAWAAAPERPPTAQFTAVRMTQALVIDGTVSPGEWDGALTTSAVMAAFDYQLLTAPTEMSFGFDDQRLYFLFRCTRAPGEWRLSKSVRTNDGYSFGDPSVEVWVSPPKAVPETYQSVINTYPAILDNHMIPSRGYTAQGWTGKWDVGVSEDPDQYIIEASIPIADFGLEQIRDNDVWQLLLCRSAIGGWPRPQGSWSITTGFAEIPQHPPVRLRDDDIAVQLRQLHTLFTGHYQFPITLVAPRQSDAEATVELRFHQAPVPGGESDITTSKTLQLKAGDRQTLDFTGDVPADWTRKVSINKESREVPAGHLTITVTRKDGRTVFRQTIPYAATGYAPARPIRPANQPLPPEIDAIAQYGPENNVLVLRTDILDLPRRQEVQGGYVRLLDPADGNRELKRHPLAPFAESYSDTHFVLDGVEIPLQDHTAQDAAYAEIKRIKEENKDGAAKRKELANRKPKGGEAAPDPASDPALQPLPVPEPPPATAPRKVLVEVTVTDEDGKPIQSTSKELSLLQQKFTWQKNTVGMSDKVIPPWSPVEVDGDTFGVWNRKLSVDGLAMLQSADNGGTQQIQSMRLVAIKDGQPVVIQAGAPAIYKQTDAAVTFAGEGNGAGLKLNATSTLEMDGYVLTDLTVAPAGGEAQVDKLYLEVVLPDSEATHFATTAGGWAAVHDQTPAYWSSQKTASGVLIGDFVPYIWLTNSDRGFLWVADNDKGWITEDQRSHPTQEIIRENGTVTLRIHFIEVPTTLTEPTSLRYAYQNFPARPLPGGWRSWVCANSPAPGAPSARHTYFYPDFTGTDWVILWPYYGSPFPHSWERSKRYWDRFSERPDHRPTVGSIAHSIGRYMDYTNRSFNDFAVDWGEQPGHIGNADITQSRGPIDFRVYYYDQWIRRSGMRMLYIDENYISYDRNFLTGGAYYKPDGRLQPGYTYLGLRDYYKRLTYAMREAGAEKPNLWMHISSGAAYHAWWADVFMEGENVAPTDEQFDYIEVLPAARMRAIGSAKAAGGAMLMMCQPQRHPTAFAEKHIHQFVGWVLAHDILPEQIHWFQPIAEAAQFHRDDVEFIGYWHSHIPAKTTTPDSIVSLHKVPGRAILWIVNTSREDRAIDVAVDWQKLGLDRSRTTALNAETGAVVPLTDAGLRVDTLKRDFVAVHLVERPVAMGDATLRATFEESVDAEFALGAAAIEGGTGQVDGKQGKALGVGQGVTVLPHLSLNNQQGQLSFAADFTGKPGVVVRNAHAPAKKDQPPLPPGFVLEVKAGKGKEPARLILRTDARDGPQIVTNAPAAGWHELALAWRDGQMRLTVDDQPVDGTIPLSTLQINERPGAALLHSARFVFGEKAAAITAVDDLVAQRQLSVP